MNATSVKRDRGRGLLIALRIATVVVVSAIALGALALAIPQTRARIASILDERRPYSVGKRIDLRPQEYSSAGPTLVIVASKSCPYCEKSVPTFRRLAASLGTGAIAQVTLLAADQGALKPEYASDLGLAGRAFRLDLDRVRVSGVPTLILVDRNRRVLASFVGALSDDIVPKIEWLAQNSR